MVNHMLSGESSMFTTRDVMAKDDVTAPLTPTTSASTPHTSDRQMYTSGSIGNMPTITSLEDSESRSTSPMVPDIISDSIRTCDSWRVRELNRTLNKKPDKVQDDLTMNKLKLDSIGIVGRQEEIKTLKACVQRMVTAKRSFDKAMKFDSGFLKIPSKELVFIRGDAGVGKTTIARKLSSYVPRSKGGLFVEGKFDCGNQVPFAQIANIFRGVCREILSISEESAYHIGDIVDSELGDQRDILLCMVPELREVLGLHMDYDDDSSADTFEVEYIQQRWKYAFRVLSRALSAVVSPLVLLLDDIQWADIVSIDFINHLICDEQNPNPFMIVGCYRSNEILPNSPLAERIQVLINCKVKFRYNVTEVELGNCTVDDVQDMLVEMMSIDIEKKVEGLAQVVFQRTRGNAYYVIEFMAMLQQEWFLSFNLVTMKWSWDENEIERRTTSTTNVVHMLQSRIQCLSNPAKKFLKCAACLGSSFQKSTMTMIWNEYRKVDETDTVEALIATLSDQHIIEQCGDGECEWVHDKMQEVVQDFLNGSDRAIRAEIGRILLDSLDKEELEDQLFMVVDLINHSEAIGLVEVVLGKIEFAKLNLQAAKKARDISAFQAASSYVTHGIRMLPEDKWTDHLELTVELCTMGALMELALGNGDGFDDYSAMVFEKRGDCTAVETMPLQVSKVCKLSTVDLQHKEAVDYSLATLKDWGTKVSRRLCFRSLHAKAHLSRAICMAKHAPAPQDIHEALGTMTDPKLLNTMKLLLHLRSACWVSNEVYLKIAVICKTVELTLKHGLNDAAAPAFASLGMLAVALRHDVELGARFSRLALAIQGHVSASSRAETLYIVHTYCLSHTEPLKSVSVPYNRAYSSGLRVGRNDYAIWALVCNQILAPWMMGKSMVSLKGLCPEVFSQAEDVSQRTQSTVVKVFWQAMVNFSTSGPDGRLPKNASQLEGKIFSAQNFKGTDPVALAFVHLVQGELLLFFDIKQAAERALQCGDKFVDDAPAMFIGVMETFHRAVALYAMARRTKKRKYRKLAKALRKRIAKFLDAGNPNVKHYEIFLNAEQAALDNRNELADTRYRRAIVYAARTGHLHHTALFNERYAEFLNAVKDDEYETKNRTNEAIRFYREWGAFAKASELSKEL
ncbi:MAG: hypothetical protein SGBAC_011395 [Bacillariaceae sp.]